MTTLTTREASLRRRLIVTLVTGVISLWLLGMLAAGFAIRREVNEIFDAALQEVVQGILPLAFSDILNREQDQMQSQRAPTVKRRQESISYIVRDRSGQILLQSYDADLNLFPRHLKLGFEDTDVTRLYSEEAVSNTIIATAAEKPGHRRRAILDATMSLAVPLIILVPAMLAGIWFTVDQACRRLDLLGRQIAARGGSNLTGIPDEGLPGELKPVVQAVNTLLTRLRRTLESERSFTANSAHELRTPIAGALSQAQRLLAEMPAPKAQARLVEIERSLQRLARTSERLLQLARAEGSALLGPGVQDLAPVLNLILGDFTARDGARFEAHVNRTVSKLDIDAFAIVARNLVENALRHGEPHKPVVVSLLNDRLSVRNAGPVLSPEQFARFSHRFEKGRHRQVGSGLGLAIVATIAEGSGGRLDMLSPIPGEADGVEMLFTLPPAS